MILSEEVVFASPRTGTVQQIFDFRVFNTDPLQLPDTMVYEVFGYSVRRERATVPPPWASPELVAYGLRRCKAVNTDRAGSDG